jgi:hypothetical protein
LIARIGELDPRLVTQVVLVSADSDFNPVVQEKWVEGIDILWVASRIALDPVSGESMISPQLEIEFESKFKFVELARFKSRLSIKQTCLA